MNNYDAGASTILFNNAGNQLMRLTFAAPSVPEAQGSGASSDSNLSSSNRFVNDDLELVERLKFFLATAPSYFGTPLHDLYNPSQISTCTTTAAGDPAAHPPSHEMSTLGNLSTTSPTDNAINQDFAEEHRFRRFLLPNGEYISCVLWNGLYHITGTDIIRTLVFRFRAFGRCISNMKKFEEGVFSDLRNLKAGIDATLGGPKVR